MNDEMTDSVSVSEKDFILQILSNIVSTVEMTQFQRVTIDQVPFPYNRNLRVAQAIKFRIP